MEKLVCRFSFVVASFFVLNHSVHASLLENVGGSSASSGLAGISAQGPGIDTAALSNPAMLSGSNQRSDRLRIQFSVVSLVPDLQPINNVVVSNEYASGTLKSGNVDTDYKITLGTVLSIGYQFGAERKWGAGIFAYIPTLQMFYTDTGETYVPEYFLHRSRTQRPQIAFAGARTLGNGFSVGFGAQLAYALTGNGNVYLSTNTGESSNMRFSAAMKPLLQPYFGIALDSNSNAKTGLVFRFAKTSDVNFTLNSTAKFFGALSALDFNFKALSAMSYDPASMELAQTLALNDRLTLFGQIDAQLWQSFRSPALSIQDPSTTGCTGGGCGLSVSPSLNPNFRFRNIVIPRIGIEWKAASVTFRSGYFYRPGILPQGAVNGAGNFLDPSRHNLSLGAGIEGKKFLEFDAPYRLDFHVSYQSLISETVTKTAGNEAGSGTEPKIGSPGYTVGGKLVGAGISLSLQI